MPAKYRKSLDNRYIEFPPGRFEQLMIDGKWTNADLAHALEKVGRSRDEDSIIRRVSRWRNGGRVLKSVYLKYLLKLFNCHSEQELIGNSPAVLQKEIWSEMEPVQSDSLALEKTLSKESMFYSISRCIESFWIPEEMWHWFARPLYRKENWSEERISNHYDKTRQHWNDKIELHMSGKFTRRVILREDVFIEAAREEPRWVLQIADDLENKFANAVKLALVPQDLWVSKYETLAIKTGTSNPCSFTLVDKRLAIKTPLCGGNQLATRNVEMVAKMHAAITEFASEVETCPENTPDRLRKIARNLRSTF